MPPNINTPRIKLMLKAIHEHNPEPNRKWPITFPTLALLCDKLSEPDSLLYRAALCVAFFGGLRGAEYTYQGGAGDSSKPLLLNHVTFGHYAGKWYMVLRIPRTKTRPHGLTIHIGCSGHPVCAVCTMWSYLTVRNTVTVSPTDFLFSLAEGLPLSKQNMNNKIKALVTMLGLPSDKFSTHSLRAGVVTSGAAVGLADWELKKLGNWASSVYSQYIREIPEHNISFAQRIAAHDNFANN